MSNRTAKIERKTNETDIKLELDLDGSGYEMSTGVGFFDHMLDHIARHGQIALNIQAKGDLEVDDHHTVEDVGIVLGQAIDKALGDKRGIERYGSSDVCMDESLARVALDLSGRPAFVYKVEFKGFGKIGNFDVQLVQEFFNAVVNNAKMNLHIEVPWGENNHHISEAVFKAFGRALRQAIEVTGDQIPSTKGSL
ncbi:imidazoleglycerol-phosphate dehydratase HisB [Planctomycetota bacterium]|nr:imidazoleglycerol-phosphate dehydratase HisB [Planctomycetota bacterium]